MGHMNYSNSTSHQKMRQLYMSSKLVIFLYDVMYIFQLINNICNLCLQYQACLPQLVLLTIGGTLGIFITTGRLMCSGSLSGHCGMECRGSFRRIETSNRRKKRVKKSFQMIKLA